MDAQTPSLPAPAAAPVENWRDGLTAKMAAFVEHYARWRNATQAYTHAYDTNGSYETRRDEGAKLLADPRVQAAIKARQKAAVEATGVDVGWLLGRFMDIATADPRELIGLKVGCCRYCYGDDHKYQWRDREYMEAVERVEREAALYPDRAKDLVWPDIAGGFGFNATHPPRGDCPTCHGEGLERFVPRDTDRLSDSALLLYGGVKVKKDGYEIVMADRSKALELAGRIVGAFNDKVKISGTLAHLHAVQDLRSVDPQEAAKLYEAFVSDRLTG